MKSPKKEYSIGDLIDRISWELRVEWEKRNVGGEKVAEMSKAYESLSSKSELLTAIIFIGSIVSSFAILFLFFFGHEVARKLGLLSLSIAWGVSVLSLVMCLDPVRSAKRKIDNERSRLGCRLGDFRRAVEALIPKRSNLLTQENLPIHLGFFAFDVVCAEEFFNLIRMAKTPSLDAIIREGERLSLARHVFAKAYAGAQEFGVEVKKTTLFEKAKTAYEQVYGKSVQQ